MNIMLLLNSRWIGMMRMNKKKTIIIITYLLTLVIFITIAELNIDNFVHWYMETMDYGNILIALGPIVIATVLHVLITVIIAIIVRFIKNIDKDVKKIIYILPIITLFIWFPLTFVISKIVL